MAYLGNTPTTQSFSPAIDYFSGNGSTTSFTLSRAVAAVAQVQVVIENVPQNPTDAFTVSGSTITFTSAPPSGTNNIYVYYTSPITQLIQPGYGTVGQEQLKSDALTPAAISDKANTSTGSLSIPVGTTAQRPGTPANGMIRYNSTTNQFEVYQNGVWINYNTTYSVEYVVVAGGGGGGGGQYNGGGGGAGGYRSSVTGESSGGGAAAESPLTLTSGTAYTVTIGAGGTGGTEGPGAGAGGNSVFGSITSVGGGRGGNHNSPATGGSGGSGGGGSQGNNAGGSGTSGQGYAGGGTWYAAGAGGGGAGAAVPSGNGNAPYTGGSTGVSGGVGVASSITGSSVFRAGGGGGGGRQQYGIPQGLGGNGGGGNGGPTTGGNGSNGTANTGGGGGGTGSDADNTTQRTGGTGGSGVVIIRYLGGQRGTGGTVTSSGGYTIHTFTTSGTYTA